MPETYTTRRRVLAGGLLAGSMLAGCSRSQNPTTTSRSTTDAPSTASGETSTTTPPQREAVDQWQQLYYDPRNSSRREVDVGPAEPAKTAWRANILPSFPFVPIVQGERMFVTGNEASTMYAIDVTGGSTQWTRTFDSPHVTTASHSNLVFVSSAGSIQSLDPVDGGQQWRHPVDFDRPGMLTPTSDTVYCLGLGEDADRILAIQSESGDERWTYTTDDASLMGFAVGPSRLYVTTTEPASVIALDRERGTSVWQRRFDVQTNNVYVPTVDGDRIYVGGLNFTALYALDAASGDDLWQAEMPTPTGASLLNDGLVVGGAGTIARLDRADGAVAWQRDLEGTLTFRPAVTPSRLYVGELIVADSSLEGSPLHVLDPGSGDPVWEGQLDGALWTAPFTTDAGLFGVLRDGTVFCRTAP